MKQGFLRLALACGFLLLASAVQAQTALTDIDQALKVAQAKQLPVFIDFSAVWCHACHEMDAKVLNGAEWEQRQKRFVLVRSDADSVNGTAWMKKLVVPALPTYLVLNPDGSERGRLLGEIKRDKFYAELDRVLSGADAIDKLKAEAVRGSVAAAAKVLLAYDQRSQQDDGLRWFAGLPAATRKAVQGDAAAATRLAIVQAHAEKNKLYFSRPKLGPAPRTRVAGECRAHAQAALAGPLELEERFAVAGTLLSCAKALPPAERHALAAAQLPALKALYDKKVPTAGSGALRTATYTLADYYQVLGDNTAEKATYTRAIAIGRKALDDGHGNLDVKRDRSMADVLGEFLGRKGPEAENTALLQAMIKAYPDDFIYQYEYGSDLLKHGKAADALPYLERASNNATPVWKLGTTYARAKALVALGRRPEAEKLLNAALRQAEAQFPEQTRYEKMGMKL